MVSLACVACKPNISLLEAISSIRHTTDTRCQAKASRGRAIEDSQRRECQACARQGHCIIAWSESWARRAQVRFGQAASERPCQAKQECGRRQREATPHQPEVPKAWISSSSTSCAQAGQAREPQAKQRGEAQRRAHSLSRAPGQPATRPQRSRGPLHGPPALRHRAVTRHTGEEHPAPVPFHPPQPVAGPQAKAEAGRTWPLG